MTAEPDDLPLNAPQRRHFEVVLASLENALASVEALVHDPAAGSRRMTRVANDLPPGVRDRAAAQLMALRTSLGDLADQMRLEAHPVSAERTVNAILTAQIVHIQDSYAHSLRGYGDVHPDLALRLDPVLESIEGSLVELRATFRRQARGLQRGEAP